MAEWSPSNVAQQLFPGSIPDSLGAVGYAVPAEFGPRITAQLGITVRSIWVENPTKYPVSIIYAPSGTVTRVESVGSQAFQLKFDLKFTHEVCSRPGASQ